MKTLPEKPVQLTSSTTLSMEELAGLAQEVMSTSDSTEQAVIFSIEPNAQLERFISQITSNAALPIEFCCTVTSYEANLIQGVGDQAFAYFVSKMVRSESQETYVAPAQKGHVACFLIQGDEIYRIDVMPQPRVFH